MIYNLLFVFIWIAIIILAKDRIIIKVKKFLNIPIKNDNEEIDSSEGIDSSELFKNIERAYFEINSTLSIDCLSIKDELHYLNYIKTNHPDINSNIEEDIIKESDYFTEKVDMYKVFKKTLEILKNLFSDLFNKIKNYLF